MNRGHEVQQLLREAGRLEWEQQWGPARAAYRRLLALEPAIPDSWYNLARLERRLGNPLEALACYRRALEFGVGKPEEVHLNRGVILCDDLREYMEAEVAVRAALQINPRYLPALLNLEYLCELLGRRDEAVALCEQILALQPDQAAALARLAELHRFSDPHDPLLERLREALRRPEMHPAEAAAIGFAFGRALDEIGDFEAAFAAYARANRYSRLAAADSGPLYDRVAEVAQVDSIINAFALPVPAVASPQPRPVFIVGLLRSGAAVLEQLLATHPRVYAGGECPQLPLLLQGELAPFPDRAATLPAGALADMAGRYLQGTRAGVPAGHLFIDRQPGGCAWVGLIKLLFPDALILHTTRDLRDNGLAIWFQHLGHSAGYALDLRDIAHHVREQQRLMAHWHSMYGSDILDVDYDALVRDPQGVLAGVLRFMGLELDAACASGLASLEPHHSGRWRNYRNDLDELAGALGVGLD
jgi:tetratricopeptide (TPR) repeat protein